MAWLWQQVLSERVAAAMEVLDGAADTRRTVDSLIQGSFNDEFEDNARSLDQLQVFYTLFFRLTD